VLVASGNGNVWALDAVSGERRWSTAVGSEVLAPPATDGRVVVAQTFDGRLVGLDAADGRRLWSYAAGAPVLMLRGTSTPLIQEGAVIAGFANGKVAAIELASGKPYWEARVATPSGTSEIERLVDVAGELLVEDGVLYVGSYQGNLSAIELRSGRRLWARPASTYVGVAHGFGNVYVATADGSVVAMADNDQGPRWEQSVLARRGLSGVAAIGNVVAVGDVEGYLHLLAQSDGRLVGRQRMDRDGIRATPLVEGGILYVYGNSGDIVAYRVESLD
jgi:outer membrane protein assembly factor BamB